MKDNARECNAKCDINLDRCYRSFLYDFYWFYIIFELNYLSFKVYFGLGRQVGVRKQNQRKQLESN